MTNQSLRPIPQVSRQDGVVLFIALIVLVAMTMIGISIIRQGSSSQIIIGNLAFREGATTAADHGIEAARNWLVNQTGDALKDSSSGKLNASSSGNDYVYVADGLADTRDLFTDAPWPPKPESSLLENKVWLVIQRLCPKKELVTADDNLCIVNSTTTSSKEGIDYANRPIEGLQPYYRVTVRVDGPRNTTSYVQALLF